MKKLFGILVLFSLFLCGCANEKTNGSPEDCFDDFFNNKISAHRSDGTELWNKDLTYDDNDLNYYRIGEQVDVDNDGEKEQLIDGLGGGFFLDCRNNQLYIWPEFADHQVGDLTYRQIEGEYWIIYMDALHSNREYYRIIKYKGTETIEDIEIKKFEEENRVEYYINSELSTEEAFLNIKMKYIGE